MTFVRTKQFLSMRFKGIENPIPVHIPQKLIERSFFKYPEYNRKECLKDLTESGQLRIEKKNNFFTYSSLTPGELDFSLIQPGKDNFKNEVILKIREDLKNVSLIEGSPSTEYFDAFLKFKDKYIKLFFTVDEFARRIHTPVTNLHREYRENILLFDEQTISFDVATMQPVLLGKILFHHIGKNEYSDWINDGQDIYVMLQEKASLKTRDEAKTRFFEILFAPPSNGLANMFGGSNWINWINEYKTKVITANPHNHIKRYSNLAWKLQTTEVKIMYQVWSLLYKNNIPFLTIHDEVRVRVRDERKAERLFSQVLDNEFQYFKLNAK